MCSVPVTITVAIGAAVFDPGVREPPGKDVVDVPLRMMGEE